MHTPGFFGNDCVTCAVVVLEFELCDCPQRPVCALKLAEPVTAFDVVHPVAECQADRVAALTHQRRDIVSFVESCAVVFRPAGRQQPVARFLAVDRHLELAEATHMGDRTLQAGFDVERTPQQERFGGPRGDDPFGSPVLFSHDAHREGCRRAPLRHTARFVPCADFPEHLLRRLKRFASIRHVQRFVRLDLAAAPKVAFIAG